MTRRGRHLCAVGEALCAAQANEAPSARLASVVRRRRLLRRTRRTASAGVCVSACSVALRKQVFPRFRSPAPRRVGTVHCGFGSVRRWLRGGFQASVPRTSTDSAAASSSGVGAAGGVTGAAATGGGGDCSACGLTNDPAPRKYPWPCISGAGARRRAPGDGRACHTEAQNAEV